MHHRSVCKHGINVLIHYCNECHLAMIASMFDAGVKAADTLDQNIANAMLANAMSDQMPTRQKSEATNDTHIPP